MRRDGDSYRTSRDIVPDEPLGSSFVAGAAFRRGLAALREGGFIVGGDDFVHLLDPAGNLLRSAQIREAISVERKCDSGCVDTK